MVDEFSSFSRMPQAVLKPENLSEICRQVLFLENNRGTGIDLANEMPETDVNINCDSQQVSRALTNIVKNAAESVSERIEKDGEGAASGTIRFVLTQHDTLKGPRTSIVVEDNGTGLPITDLTRLTEPYVTTRAKGTGLGLAIVKKIMEDHGGDLLLENRTEGGARAILTFPPRDAVGETDQTDRHSAAQASE